VTIQVPGGVQSNPSSAVPARVSHHPAVVKQSSVDRG
jgi:hypothetical protein